MSAISRRRAAPSRRWLTLGILAGLLVSCDVGHSIVADNTTDTQMRARLSGVTGSNDRFSYVVIVPARTRLVIALQPFTSPRINHVEILKSDCTPVGDFVNVETGALFVINEGPTAEQRREFPTGSPTAERTDDCPGPDPPPPTPTPRPTATPLPSVRTSESPGS